MICDEQLLSGPAAVEAVSNDRPSYATFFRWCESGLRARDGQRVRLEYVKCGSVRKTSTEAVRRFFQALSMPSNGADVPSRTNRQREQQLLEAEKSLES